MAHATPCSRDLLCVLRQIPLHDREYRHILPIWDCANCECPPSQNFRDARNKTTQSDF